MRACIFGYVSTVGEYKVDGAVVRRAYISSGQRNIRVDLAGDQDFNELDFVLVWGEIATYNKDVFVSKGVIELADAATIERFRQHFKGISASRQNFLVDADDEGDYDRNEAQAEDDSKAAAISRGRKKLEPVPAA